MFSFGQFAHLLPYLLVAITSFIGWSSYAMASHKTEVAENSSRKVLINSDESDQLNEAQNILDLLYPDQAITRESISFNTSILTRIFEYPPGLSEHFIRSGVLRILNQRPPPVIVFA